MRCQWGLGTKPSTAKLRVALGIRTFMPSSSFVARTWQPSRDLQQEAVSAYYFSPQVAGQCM